MSDSRFNKKDNLLNISNIFGKSTPFFSKLSQLPNANDILKGYIDSIKDAAQKGHPYYIIISIDEFSDKEIMSIQKQMNEYFNALVYLTEKMGYYVKNKHNGVFYDEEVVGITLEISKKDLNANDELKQHKVLRFN